ncbi:histidine phosphatase superfamily [Mariannaea sp. PMI_226]|nr:histidine phosphatase superfamily [Mariannaea sp. PMI_226]
MTKPRLIILVRHGQSEGNSMSAYILSPPFSFSVLRLHQTNLKSSAENRDIHQTIPDHRVKLTPEGWNQAHDAGRRLRELLRPDDTLHFFTSPYRRTRETTEGILSTLTSDDPDPSPFRRSNIKVYEEPRLREQDFGNFQPCSAEMERMWQERADYGHFFYRIPNGESAADAYDRVSGFNESLWRQFGEDDFASVCVLVTHGLMSRVFLMKWYHFTVEYFEDLRNINHCEFLIMRKRDNGKYILENNLRTWSELRRERSAKEIHKDKDKEEKEREKDSQSLQRTKTFVVTRRWGGCPNGCNHSSHYVKREDLEILRQEDSNTAIAGDPSATHVNGKRLRQNLPTNGGAKDGSDAGALAEDDEEHENTLEINTTRLDKGDAIFSSAEDAKDEITPYMHKGRDGGGTYSGHTSIADSDSEDEKLSLHRVASLNAHLKSIKDSATPATTNGTNGSTSNGHPDKLTYADENGTSEHRRSNRLGDASPDSSIGSPELEDLDEAEKEDRSIEGSVY